MEENLAATEEALAQAGDAGILETAAEEIVPPKKQKRRINRAKLQDNIWGWAFCVPLIVGTVWFVYSALVMALLLSFTDFAVGSTKPDAPQTLMDVFRDYANNIYLNPNRSFDEETGMVIQGTAFRDPFYWYKNIFTNTVMLDGKYAMNQMGAYLFNTVFYMIGIPIGMILSMFFAVCMSRDIRGGNLFRVLYYIPCVASSISIVYTFRILFQQTGVMNSLFGSDLDWMGGGYTWNGVFGTSTENAFMDSTYWCQGLLQKLIIIIMSVWKGLGGTIILYVAGLSGVNAATKEAAQIDGASGWQIFWKVTMPDLYPVIFYNIVTSVIGGMQIYAEPVLLFGEVGMGSNPYSAVSNTSGYVSLVWLYGLNNSGQGQFTSGGAAYGMFLAVIIFVMTLFQFWLDSRKKD